MTTKIYVIGSHAGPKKIGYSANPAKRCAAINGTALKNHSVLHCRDVPASIVRSVEGHVHFLLQSALKRGEWFNVSLQEALDAIDASMEISGSGTQAKRPVGRKKEFPNRVTLPLSDEMLAGIDAVRDEGEDRLTVIRAAIERELKRRSKAQKDKG